MRRGSTDSHDGGAQTGMGRQDTVIAVAVHAGRRHEGNEALQELERREDDLGAPVWGGFGKPIQKVRVGRGQGGDAGEGMKAFEGEGRAGTVAEEALEAGTVVTLDAHGSVDAEPTGSLPREHVTGVELVEQRVGAEVPKHAALNDALEPEPVFGLEERRLVEDDIISVPIVDSGEDAVEDDQVEVEMRVERRAEAVQEADSSELGVGGRTGTRATDGGADRAQEDPEDGACDVRVVMQEGTQALGEREDPLPRRKMRQHVIREVRGEFRHAARVAGGADSSALARERDQALVTTVLAASPGEPVGEDAAPQVGSEVLLDPPRNTVAQGIGFRRAGEEGLEMMLDDRVERRGLRPSRAIRRRDGRTCWPGR
jgi:hypothetical protein